MDMVDPVHVNRVLSPGNRIVMEFLIVFQFVVLEPPTEWHLIMGYQVSGYVQLNSAVRYYHWYFVI